ncbi:MAG: hypothetical protein MK137_07010 [Rickettsiales bacterium]|nr:hypothetical protein [Rickettsiales bacterium]
MKKSFKHIFLFSIIIAFIGIISLGMLMLSQDIEPEFRPIEREISLEQLSGNKDV